MTDLFVTIAGAELRHIIADARDRFIRDHIPGVSRISLGQCGGRPAIHVWTEPGAPVVGVSPALQGYPIVLHRSET